MASLTEEGLQIDTVEEIREDINARLRKKFGDSLDLSNESIEGQMVGIISERLGNNEELLEVLYDAMDPDRARGFLQDSICAITGTERPTAAFSTAVVYLTGDEGTSVLAGQQVGTGTTDFFFITQEEGVLEAVDEWQPSTVYAVGDLVTYNYTTDYVYVCITAGISESHAGPEGHTTGDLHDLPDNTVHWARLGEGLACDTVEVQCNITGPNAAPSFSINSILTPVSGWLGVLNIDEASVGRNVATDEELAVLREVELAQPGTSPIPAIRAALINLPGVTSVKVFYNNHDATDVDGVPGHSIEAMVQGGDDQAIFQCLFDNTAGGIGYHGTETGTVVDSEGESHEIKFSRPTEIPIYIALTITKDPTEYPDDGNDLVADSMVNYGNAQKPGRDAVATAIQSRAFKIDGVLKVVSCFIGLTPGPVSSADIVITSRQLATYSLDNTSVSSSDGTP